MQEFRQGGRSALPIFDLRRSDPGSRRGDGNGGISTLGRPLPRCYHDPWRPGGDPDVWRTCHRRRVQRRQWREYWRSTL